MPIAELILNPNSKSGTRKYTNNNKVSVKRWMQDEVKFGPTIQVNTVSYLFFPRTWHSDGYLAHSK